MRKNGPRQSVEVLKKDELIPVQNTRLDKSLEQKQSEKLDLNKYSSKQTKSNS